MVVEHADTVLERAVCTAAELGGATAPAEVVAMPAHAESPLGRSAQLAGSVVVEEDPDQGLSRTWGQARESTYRRRPTNMLGPVVILTRFDPEGISLASSQVVVF